MGEEDTEMESPDSECERSASPVGLTEIGIKFLSGEMTDVSYPCDMSILQLKKELAETAVQKGLADSTVLAEMAREGKTIRVVHAGKVLEEDTHIGTLIAVNGQP